MFKSIQKAYNITSLLKKNIFVTLLNSFSFICMKIPLRIINQCYSLVLYVVLTFETMFTSFDVSGFQECSYKYIIK